MNLENALNYVTHHSETIIQWTFLSVVALGAVVVAGGIFKRRQAGGSSKAVLGGAQAEEIQAALQRLLEQTSKLENVTLTGAAPGVVADVDSQVKDLRAELSAREAEIATLKASGGSGAAPDAVTNAATDVASGLAVRVKELESKLAEYAILEDDIADLSLFKDENLRLKAELESYKAGGAPAPAAAASMATAVPSGDDGVTSADLIVEEFAQVIQQKAPEEEPESDVPATEVAASSSEPEPVPVAEVAAAPEPTTSPEPEPAPAPEPAPEPLAMPTSVPDKVASNPFAAAPQAAAPAGDAAAPAVAAEADDLFAEFAQEPAPDDDALDTSKMMAEMDALAGLEPSTTDSLEAAIDTDKMADEATSLAKS